MLEKNPGNNKTTIIGKSQPIKDTMELALLVAKTDFPVLVSGESGVGKGIIARYIHDSGPRKNGPFITVNSAAFPETLLDDEMFGHEKGAFSGATDIRKGKFEAAQGGTLFLDEVGEMSSTLQAKLLRVLQEKEIERLGGNKTIYLNVRIIVATNKNLDQLIAEGKFREDLFFRLNAVTLEVPPLKDRQDDIPELAEYILIRNCQQQEKHFVEETVNALKEHKYERNNIRELENVIKSAIVLSGDDSCIKPMHLRFRYPTVNTREYSGIAFNANNLDIAQNITPIINGLVQKAIDKHKGVKAYTAEELGITVFHLNKLLDNPNITSDELLQYFSKYKKSERNDIDTISPNNNQKPQPEVELPSKLKVILEIAKRDGHVTNKMVQQEQGISHGTAHKLLTQLVLNNTLEKKGKSRNISYVLSGEYRRLVAM